MEAFVWIFSFKDKNHIIFRRGCERKLSPDAQNINASQSAQSDIDPQNSLCLMFCPIFTGFCPLESSKNYVYMMRYLDGRDLSFLTTNSQNEREYLYHVRNIDGHYHSEHTVASLLIWNWCRTFILQIYLSDCGVIWSKYNKASGH